ncbi:hypothetical protein CWI36_1254p0010 [Hamiltosporidium magnivora]|uniref:DUF167 domain-containing protein n=1 Tax=Hamiltosporidium magnivora TaxID=148818 RepID=A0A4Q9L402_9MICR|nr:hypothetical protein CWI36_1254p0010 [Hamiltosporidium magnivora]
MYITLKEDGFLLDIKVITNMQSTKIRTLESDSIVIEVRLFLIIKYLSSILKVKKDNIRVVSGHKSKQKTIHIEKTALLFDLNDIIRIFEENV